MGNVIKHHNIVPIKNQSNDLIAFIFDELKDHVERLYDCASNGSDQVTIEYHHEKSLDLIEKLENKIK